jgi:hypothetical protein
VRRVLAGLLALTVAACASKPPSPAPTPTVEKPRLVVLVVIDQWPSWMFQQQKHVFKGGIARLLREGAIVDAARLPYASSFTAVGHATLATGAIPRETGVVGNYWYRRAEGRDRPAEYDPDSMPLVVGPALGGADLSPDDGASGKPLRVEGVADALRTGTNGAGKSVAISLKSRSACLVAGRKPDLAVWYEPGAGGMTTSAAYASAPPPWLLELAKGSPPSRFYESVWTPQDPALLARETNLPDDAAGESSNHGLGAAFPHTLKGAPKVAYAIQETPFADELVAQTVLVAIDELQLGRDATPDFLAVSFSAHDYAGHSWGQESWEVLDLTLRLDMLLAELFAALDTRVGEDRWAVVLTSDHGATPIVERAKSAGARRIPTKEIEAAGDKAIAEVVGAPGPWVVKIISNNIYLTPKIRELTPDVKGRALDAAVKAIAAIPSVGGAVRVDRVEPTCKGGQEIDRAVCNGIVPDEAGDLYVYAAQGSVITDAKFGTGHDAPSDDNRLVPILVKAPGLAPRHDLGTTLQVAPTLAALLGVAPPAAAREKPLFGITP